MQMTSTPTSQGLLGMSGQEAAKTHGEVPQVLRASIVDQAINHPIRAESPRARREQPVRQSPSSSWYQLESDAYAPFGAVLTGSTGDLIFAINATYGYMGTWDNIAIYIPSNFTVPDASQVVSTLTNDYSGITVNTAHHSTVMLQDGM